MHYLHITGSWTPRQQQQNCPGNVAHPSMVCYRTTISVAGAADMGVEYAVGGGASKQGTIILFGGGGGTGPFDKGFVTPLFQQNNRIVQVMWDSAWEDTNLPGPGGKSILAAAERPATLIEHIFQEVHNSDRSKRFGIFGHSGGSGQVAYALAHYNAGDLVDCAMMSAGPVFGRIDRGCHPGQNGQNQAAPKRVCPNN